MKAPTDEMYTVQLLNRIQGSLLAGAIGDALGAPVEFLKIHEIIERFGKGGITDFVAGDWPAGTITDDTQLTFFTVEGLIRAQLRGSLKGICYAPGVVHHAYLRWLLTQGHEPAFKVKPDGWLYAEKALHARRAPGLTCISSLEQSISFGATADNDSKGCGTVMRSAPFGFLQLSTDQIYEMASETSRTTHGHETAAVSAGALAILIRFIAAGDTIRNATEKLLGFLGQGRDGNGETKALVRAALDLSALPDWKDHIPELGEGWVAEEALAIALLCALAADDMREALLAAVNHSGDSDSTGAICGNILGAQLGFSAIPTEWLDKVELVDVALVLAADLSEAILETGEFLETTLVEERYPGW